MCRRHIQSQPTRVRANGRRTVSDQDLTQEREGLIRLVNEGHLRGIIGQLTVGGNP